ncbi:MULTISPECIES: methionine/alanine import family NSS transporter small subunit [Isoptericola]|uniref:Methionine/alanine import family NSS transporter small subunit n=1 Tax=Isoptericola sediminis TaxID=2733572 RepID=A0A849JVD7_9MICO|nr:MULTISPECIES: methionine/alanine import family NSS transporter small subunit [Isoptericola]MDO8143667.1 methionine/alanine import family NSS transporter small subunit [Isoptericola sp. 178]MDO8147564.1 methionine/alanine import family NSS transporter small subunit [Isoptericola sp. b515]MDO8150134.1 methionine/alanine import family NSS transporter small subunit [Isoptericola sp. b408]NNU27272.1 methionine/alanine import family NSS transporter small subunit [Isoptericola sediminis]
MSTTAIIMMVVALLVVWGGLTLAIMALRSKPERTDFPPGGVDDHREDMGIIEHDT